MEKDETLEEIKEYLGLNQVFAEKLLRIEKLTMLAKDPNIDARYQGPPDEEEFPGSTNTIAFQLRSLLLSLSDEEHDIVGKYLKSDYWLPSDWSAGNY